MPHSSMTRNDWIRAASVAIITVGALVLLYPFWPIQDVLHLGLDLQGGVRFVLEPTDTEGLTNDEIREKVQSALSVLRNRIDQYGLANAETRQLGVDRILVNIPGVEDVEQAEQLIGQTAILEFREVIDVAESPTEQLSPSSGTEELLRDRDGLAYIVDVEPVLDGSALASAAVRASTQMQTAGNLMIALTFNQQGAERFVAALRTLDVGDRLAIVLDRVVYSAPAIGETIKEAALQGWRSVIDSTTITGQFDRDEAMRIAVVLRTGALPIALEPVEKVLVGPTLGSDSIRRGMITIATGFVLILLYMPIYYRLLGLVADVALVLNMLIVLGVLVIFGATLTLPGIAGIILTIGMTVDANVIIFERIKEERRTGKSPLASVRAGFEKSLSTLLDANVTTLLTALILLIIGTGPIQGFGITLGIGVVGSLYCALVASRLLLEKVGFAEHIPVRAISKT